MAEIPTGTVTFLFTDIEGSTLLWEQYRETMVSALPLHDSLLRSAIETNGGHVFKTVGDAFHAAFSNPVEAICASLEIQRSLQSQDWGELGQLRVRQAVHTGTTTERDGDYFGPTVNRVARLLAIGHGGQILFSQAVHDLIGDHLSRIHSVGWGIKDLGFHRLKDLTQAEHVYQLLHPSLPSDFEPLKSLDSFPNNLPRELSSFIGREEALGQVVALLRQHRLVTLTGPGGAGKTRLSLQAAAEVLGERLDGVWQVELAALQDGSRLAETVCDQLGIRMDAHQSPLAALMDYVRTRDLLLLLDNCEHLEVASARLVEQLLKTAPKLTIFATSRCPLVCTGEVTYAVAPLEMPAPVAGKQASEAELLKLSQVESVRLFVERATAALPRFTLSAANAPHVVQICRRLDGIPLALELAAVRIRLLSLEQIAHRLEDRFKALPTGGPNALQHKRTLKATIDWSYDLLTLPDQALFRRLGVFAGGWTLEAAEMVCWDAELEDYDVLENLSHLVDRSLVMVDGAGGDDTPRYRLLETLRQYALERLGEDGAEDLRVRTCHRQYFTELAEEASPHLESADCQEWLARLQAEMSNFRAALAWSVDGDERLRLAIALWRYWYQRGPAAEGRAWLEGALARCPTADDALRARALSAAGNLANLQADYAAATDLHERALGLRRKLGATLDISGSLNNLGNAALQQGHFEDASRFFGEALEIARTLGNQKRIAVALVNLSSAARFLDKPESAADLLREAIPILEGLGGTWQLAIALNNLGQTALKTEDWKDAARSIRRALLMFRDNSDRSGIILALGGLAVAAAHTGEYETAARLLSKMNQLREDHGMPVPEAEADETQHTRELILAEIGEECYRLAERSGREMDLDQTIDLALSIVPE